MPEVILKLKDRELKRVTINKAEFNIGRDPDNDLFIDNMGISRLHTKLFYRNGSFYVVDNGSSNGTFLNGKQIQEHELHEGDEIQIGKYKITYSAAGDILDFNPSFNASNASDEGADKKKVRNVFGTLQFSSDEIQNLLKQQQQGGGAAPTGETGSSKIPVMTPSKPAASKGQSPTVKANVPVNTDVAGDETPSKNNNTLIIALAGVVVVLVLVLVFVLMKR